MIQQGPLGFAHYWAEPYFGYYRSDDEWVIRKHTYQLTAAGIDFIFIDATNGQTYESTYETILKVWSKMREDGIPDAADHVPLRKRGRRFPGLLLWRSGTTFIPGADTRSCGSNMMENR